jgi:D-aminoacyl-tRNA deacylase
MKAVLQRVKKAHVEVQNQSIASIERGLLMLLCIEKGDTPEKLTYWAQRIPTLRVFADDQSKMNLSLTDLKGKLLVVSQFTLAADLTDKGRRPSFSKAENPDRAKELIEVFVGEIRKQGLSVHEGEFGASMQVHLTNDGPVTFMIDE